MSRPCHTIMFSSFILNGAALNSREELWSGTTGTRTSEVLMARYTDPCYGIRSGLPKRRATITHNQVIDLEFVAMINPFPHIADC